MGRFFSSIKYLRSISIGTSFLAGYAAGRNCRTKLCFACVCYIVTQKDEKNKYSADWGWKEEAVFAKLKLGKKTDTGILPEIGGNMSRAAIFLADGFEEIEGLTVVDVLRRAQIDIAMVSISSEKSVKGAHGITVLADALLSEVDKDAFDMLILPGGMPGTKNLGASRELAELLKRANAEQKGIAAICAAPSVLGDLGFLKRRKAVCYPGFEERLSGAEVLDKPVVTDGHITTSRGMGTAIPFALELTARLAGREEAKRIAESIIFAGF